MNYNIFIFNFFLFLWIISIPFKNAIYQASTALIVVFFLFYIIFNKDFNNVKNILKKYSDLIICFGIILFMMILSNIINDVNNESWKLTFYYFYRYGLIFFILLYFYSKNFFSKEKLLIFIFISLGIQSLDGIYQSINGFDFFKHNIGNINVSFGLTGATSNRNIFGFFMGIGLLLTILFNKNKNIFLYILSFILIFNVLFSYSRAIWVSLFVSFIFYILVEFKKFNKNHIFIFLISSIILYLIFINVESLNNRFNLLLAGNSSMRIEIWLDAIKLIKNSLLIGHGIDTLEYYHGITNTTSMHNQTLEILFDLGILGLMSFFILLIYILKELKLNNSKELFYILIFFLTNGNFGESIISSKTMLSTLTVFIFFVFVERLNYKKGILK